MADPSDDERMALSRTDLERILQEMRDDLVAAIRDEVSVAVQREVQKAVREMQPDTSLRPGTGGGGWHSPEVPSAGTLPPDSTTPGQQADRAADGESALYLYAIVDGAVHKRYGHTGIEGARVECIPTGDYTAIIHRCSPTPYQSDDEETVKRWILAHQSVIDALVDDGHPAIPSGFDTIITPREGADAEMVLAEWVRDEYASFQKTFEKIRGKHEYGVKIFCDPDVIADDALQANSTIARLEKECNDAGPGTAYLLKRSIDAERTRVKESATRTLYSDLVQRVRAVSDDMVILDTGAAGTDGQTVLMNLSCLVAEDQYSRLGDILEEMNAVQGISVRFTGPWPAYSFV